MKIRRPNIPATPSPAIIQRMYNKTKHLLLYLRMYQQSTLAKFQSKGYLLQKMQVPVRLLLHQKLSLTICVYDHLQRKSLTECQAEKEPKWTIHNTMSLVTRPPLPRKKEEWTSKGDHQWVE